MFFDIHTHLLPGVDDGVDDASKTIEILSYFKKHGINTVFLHHMLIMQLLKRILTK